MKYCADNYPPGMTGLPPEDKPVGECDICGDPIYEADPFVRHLDAVVCSNPDCRRGYFRKYPDVIDFYYEKFEKVVGASQEVAGKEKIW